LGKKGPPEHFTIKQSTLGSVQLRNKVLFEGGMLKFEDDSADSGTEDINMGSTNFSCRISVLEMERFEIDGGLLLLNSKSPSPSSSPPGNSGSIIGISAEAFQYRNPITGEQVTWVEVCS
jgi:hypothetical protein